MAVVENAGLELGKTVGSASSNRSLETPAQEASGGAVNDQDQPNHGQVRQLIDPSLHQNLNATVMRPHDQSLYIKVSPSPQVLHRSFDHAATIGAPTRQVGQVHHQRSNGGDLQRNGDHLEESFKRDMRDLRELFSKLNPMAAEFVPPSLVGLNAGFYTNNSLLFDNNNRNGNINGHTARRVILFYINVFYFAYP